MMNNITLKKLQNMLFKEYELYTKGEITQEQYLTRIRPLDAKIDHLEWSAINAYVAEGRLSFTLQDSPVLKESF